MTPRLTSRRHEERANCARDPGMGENRVRQIAADPTKSFVRNRGDLTTPHCRFSGHRRAPAVRFILFRADLVQQRLLDNALDQIQSVLDLVEVLKEPCCSLGHYQGDLILYLVRVNRLIHGDQSLHGDRR